MAMPRTARQLLRVFLVVAALVVLEPTSFARVADAQRRKFKRRPPPPPRRSPGPPPPSPRPPPPSPKPPSPPPPQRKPPPRKAPPPAKGGARRPPLAKENGGPSPPLPPAPPYDPTQPPPNIILILTDDQDYLYNSTSPQLMPLLHKHIASKGLHLNNFIVTTSVCCPSRVNLLTGKFTHNTNVTSNQDPQGGWPKFRNLKLDRVWLPRLLSPLYYNTYFTGKFINLFNLGPNSQESCPQGFTWFDPLMDKTVYQYNNFDFIPQCSRLDSFRDSYQTDVLRDRSINYISEAVSKGLPFYLQINPAAPHTTCNKGESEGGCGFPVPAARHKNKLAGIRVPRLSNYGVPLPEELKIRDTLGNGNAVNRHYQARQESMMAVDEMIEAIVLHLESLGVLNNTYIMYVSDNGYHLGSHSLDKGKQLPIEEDVRVPFYIRGPGIPEGITHPYMATMVDLTATIVTLAGGKVPDDWDGIPLPLDRIAEGHDVTGRYPNWPMTQGELRQSLPIEMWSNAFDKKIDRKDYRSVRVCTNYTLFGDQSETCWKYTVWCIPGLLGNNFRELYDLATDPGEIDNKYPLAASDPRVARLVDRLDALLQVMGYCKGRNCRDPWSVLHPGGDARSFDQAMSPLFDGLYASYEKYRWIGCAKYYDPKKLEFKDERLVADEL